MDILAFLDNVKVKFSAFKDKVITWVKENKKLAIIISSLVVLMLICIIILIAVSGNKDKGPKVYEEKLKLTQELVVPDGPELPGDYTISRETQENWSDEEAEKWFTVPSEKEINGLSKANNNMIDEILGAAP